MVFQCCVGDRGLEHCGLCLDFPCQVFLSHAPPLDVAQRYHSLRRRTELGTAAWLDEVEKPRFPKEGNSAPSTKPGAGSPPEHSHPRDEGLPATDG